MKIGDIKSLRPSYAVTDWVFFLEPQELASFLRAESPVSYCMGGTSYFNSSICISYQMVISWHQEIMVGA